MNPIRKSVLKKLSSPTRNSRLRLATWERTKTVSKPKLISFFKIPVHEKLIMWHALVRFQTEQVRLFFLFPLCFMLALFVDSLFGWVSSILNGRLSESLLRLLRRKRSSRPKSWWRTCCLRRETGRCRVRNGRFVILCPSTASRRKSERSYRWSRLNDPTSDRMNRKKPNHVALYSHPIPKLVTARVTPAPHQA